MADRVEVSRVIAAPSAAVYAAISDVTRMGEWSEECYACEWRDGAVAADVGASFDGHNRNGEHEWTTQGTVIEADPGRAFVFECSMYGTHYSTWGDTIEPVGEGCRVTEWSDDLRTPEAIEFATRVSGIADRPARNEQTMSTTLDRLATAVAGS